MNYQPPTPLTRSEAERAFAIGDGRAVCDALVGVTFTFPDRAWVEDVCVRLSSHPEPDVRALVATCIGHLARIHGELNMAKLGVVLETLARDPDPSVVGRVLDAWDDIRMYLPPSEHSKEAPS
jgi:hypothetical protein